MNALKALFWSALLLMPFSAFSQFTTVGNAKTNGNNCYELTSDSAFQQGAIWHQQALTFDAAFEFTFELSFGQRDTNGGTGIALVFQTLSDSLLPSTTQMGYGGLVSSLAIEFDTYQDSFDLAEDHLGILIQGNTNHLVAPSLTSPVPFPVNIEDGNSHLVHVSWNPTLLEMNVSWNCDTLFTYAFPYSPTDSIFGGNQQIYVGFTAATDSIFNQQAVCWINSNLEEHIQSVQVCKGDSITVSYTGGNFYSWTPVSGISAPTSATPTFFPLDTTTYTLTTTDSCNYNWNDTLTINVIAAPEIILPEDTTICTSIPWTISPVYQYSAVTPWYFWNTGSNTPALIVNQTGWYNVTINNLCGSDNDSIYVTAEDCSTTLFIPNVITPNGDGINDYFEILGTDDARYELVIYSRWGQLIFKTEYAEKVYWDGTSFSGQKVEQGVYYYILKNTNTTKTYKGTLTVL